MNSPDQADHVSEVSKHILDVASVATMVGTLVNILPAISASLTIVWMVIRIYETKTVQGWFGRRDDDDE